MKQTPEKDQNRIEMIMAVLKKRASFNDATAYETAMRVMNYFGYSDEMIDNALDSDDRKLFYFMQDLGILGTSWRLNLIRMNMMLAKTDTPKSMGDIYVNVPDRVWQDHDILSHT
jgi:hypothetical protein